VAGCPPFTENVLGEPAADPHVASGGLPFETQGKQVQPAPCRGYFSKSLHVKRERNGEVRHVLKPTVSGQRGLAAVRAESSKQSFHLLR
jgi:hypothetical protein